jgi:RNase H-like domain found in reverse transcriptase
MADMHAGSFLSKKFSFAQKHYQTHEHETIAMLEALMKWEDKLLGWIFTLVTNHKGLEYFETQKNLSNRQVQWWEFLSWFNFTIMHVDGVNNQVADCLPHYYEDDMCDESHPEHIYVNADVILDPDSCDDLFYLTNHLRMQSPPSEPLPPGPEFDCISEGFNSQMTLLHTSKAIVSPKYWWLAFADPIIRD